MDEELNITTEQRRTPVPVTVFTLSGLLDAQSEDHLLEAARIAYDTGARNLVIDMTRLQALTSAGMRALQKVYQIFTPKEERFKVTRLRLCNAPPQIYNVLGITGFLQNIPAHTSIEDALASFRSD